MSFVGFPASNSISPSVRISERDNSIVPPDQSFHRGAIIGFASKGPINDPRLISNINQLHRVFGYPHPESSDPYLIYAAEQYLRVANELIVVRVGEESISSHQLANTAEVEVPSAGGIVDIVSDTAGPYSFDKDSLFRWKLNGVLSARTLLVLKDSDHDSATVQSNGYSALQLAEDLNLQLDRVLDGIEFYATQDNKIGLKTTFAFGPNSSLEIVSVQDSIAGGALTPPVGSNINTNVTGLGQGMTFAQITGGSDRYPDDGYQIAGGYDFTGLTNLNLHIVIDGTDNINIDNIIQLVDLTLFDGDDDVAIAEIVEEINRQIDEAEITGGFEAVAVGNNLSLRTLHHGKDAKLLVKSDSTCFELFGFDTPTSVPTDDSSTLTSHATAVGTTTSGVSGSASIHTYGIVRGSSNNSAALSLTIYADSPGIEGNNTQVMVTNNERDGSFSVEVLSNGISVESFSGLTKDASSRLYAESFLSTYSDFIRVEDNLTNTSPPLNGIYTLVGGTDGIPSDPDDQDRLIIGSDIGGTGMYSVSEPEQIDIDIIAIPGHSSTSVITALIDLCEIKRRDCIAIIDPPFGFGIEEITAWQNGSHYLNTNRFNSNYAALYWPWIKIRDTYNRIDVWVPPSGSIMAVYARNDQLAAPWFAPAGVDRGSVPGILDVYTRPTLSERDLIQGNRNAVNPIIQFADSQNFVVWGQKTLQRSPTALDRVNVRRLLIAAEKRIKVESRRLLFEPHDDIFRSRFREMANRILREIKVQRGLTDYIIDVGDDLNTPDVIDRNEFKARIGLQPTKSVEFMFLEFSVHRTGSFTENADTF